MDVDQILNFGLGIGAIFAMALQKYKNAYMLFAALLAWVILSNFVRGDASNRKESFNLLTIATLVFSFILFITVSYLVLLTINNGYIFENQKTTGDLDFYLKATNALIVFIFLLISGNSDISKQLEDMFPQCGSLILILTLFLFTYLLGIMVININMVVNNKMTDG